MTVTLEELYPDLDEREREEVRERLDAYIRLVLRISERLERDAVDSKETYP